MLLKILFGRTSTSIEFESDSTSYPSIGTRAHTFYMAKKVLEPSGDQLPFLMS